MLETESLLLLFCKFWSCNLLIFFLKVYFATIHKASLPYSVLIDLTLIASVCNLIGWHIALSCGAEQLPKKFKLTTTTTTTTATTATATATTTTPAETHIMHTPPQRS